MWTYGEFHPLIMLFLFGLSLFIVTRLLPQRLIINGKRRLRALANRPWVFAGLLVVISLTLNLLFTSIFYPQAAVHDEFAYLLASDTFTSGRLTNQPHPHWEHFETFHVLSQPSYQAKYPPGNAIFMAVGQKLTGHPIVGVWIAFTLAGLCFFWMLRSWTSSGWAALGGLFLVSNGPLIRAWGQTYWAGSVAFMGGALIFGGLHRIWNAEGKPKPQDAILTGIGLVLLANSRPMEGFLVSVPVILGLLIWYFRNQQVTFAYKTFAIAMPIVLIGLTGLGLMAIYNRAVTGDATKMPYTVHDQTYSQSSLLIWKTPPQPPEYRHARMERFYREFGRQRQLDMRQPSVYTRVQQRKFRLLWNWLPVGIGLTLFPVVFLWKDPWWRLAMAVTATVILVHTQLAASWMYPHYLAPALALFFALNLHCMRLMKTWQRQSKLGRTCCRVFLVMAFLKLIPTLTYWTYAPRHTDRTTVEQTMMDESPGPHLVICSYGDEYPIVNDWVYNRADIDGSKIVWARDLGNAKNAQLFEYYADRKIWRCHFKDDDTRTLELVRGTDDSHF